MSAARERLDELLADRAIWGLSPGEERELGTTMLEVGEDAVDESWDVAAAAATAYLLRDVHETAPMELTTKLQTDAVTFFIRSDASPATAEPVGGASRRAGSQRLRQVPAASALGWWVAAAAILVAALLAWGQWAPGESLRDQREALLASAGDVVQMDWDPGTSELRGDPSGDVVWSDREQRGFMRFRGLPANDASLHQYQLWIFDAERSSARPVDGGVFDIPPGASEVIVPIDAKIAVHDAVAFAVTLEKPGGVVVSEREHVMTTAGL